MSPGILDLAIVVALLVLALRRLDRYATTQRLAWFAGTVVVAVATTVHLGGNPRQTFLATSIQFCLLFFLAPVLLALGAPVSRRESGPAARTIAFVGPVLACVVTLVWFLTPWLHLTLTNDFAYQAGHLVALGAGLLFCAPAVRTRGHDASAYPLLVFVAFVELLLDAVPGIVITVRNDLLAPTVFLAHHSAATAHTSQVHGGEVLWVIGELLDIPFLAALVYQWVRADARHAAVVDARLDAHTPRQVDQDEDEPVLQRPWWETDASVFGDRAKAFRPED